MRKTYNQIKYGAYAECERAVTLRSSSGDYGGGSEVLVVEVMPFDTTQITSKENGSRPRYGSPAYPITARGHVPKVVLRDGNGPSKRRDSAGGGCPTIVAAHEHPILISSDKNHATIKMDGISTTLTAQEDERPMISHSNVRRLTPVECLRLQGLPDDWLDLGPEWIDSKGKRHKEADAPKYKAIGNSMAKPFWFWLLRRISAQYERPAYLGSLFDGIGVAPLCWEECNGKGTALWASEIDDFCIAVTKKHFPEEDGPQSKP